MSVFPKELAKYCIPLQNTIEQVIVDFRNRIPAQSEVSEKCLDQILEYSMRPSKRIRGSLCAYIYDSSVDAHFTQEGLKAGAAIELMQNYLLIVDDVMDQSVIRRGLPTIHELYIADMGLGSRRDAEMIALLTGLLVQHIAVITMRDIDLPAENVLRASQVMQRYIAITELGQIDDMKMAIKNYKDISDNDLLRKYEQKSSYYSFVNPIESALLLADRDPSLAKKDSEKYGIPAGVAFQLRDDWLGIFGDVQKTGKSNLDDIREGKYTYMVHEALKVASDDQREKIVLILSNDRADKQDLEEIKAILIDTHAEKAAMNFADNCVAQASSVASSARSWDVQVKSVLQDMVKFSVERDK